jgi:hypothetical protein
MESLDRIKYAFILVSSMKRMPPLSYSEQLLKTSEFREFPSHGDMT